MARRVQSIRSLLRAALLAVLVLPVLAGCALSEDDGVSGESSLLPMTVVEWLFPPGADYAEADPLGVAQISWEPMRPGENTIAIAVSDLHGAPLPVIDASSEMQLGIQRLAPDAEPSTVVPSRDDATWTAEGVELDEIGWYQLDITLQENGEPVAETRTWALLPDPSVHGADAVELPASDPEAEALYEQALATYGGWESARWRESLSSGAGAVVVSEFSVTDRKGEPTAMLMDSEYVASFREREDGSPPSTPRLDFAERVTIGEESWSRRGDDGWSSRSTRPPATFEERAAVYAGGTNVRPGGTATVNGVTTEIVTFHLPPVRGQSEAWLVWWIDPDTGDILRTMMIAQMHFMVWDFTDINAPIQITPPSDALATPAG